MWQVGNPHESHDADRLLPMACQATGLRLQAAAAVLALLKRRVLDRCTQQERGAVARALQWIPESVFLGLRSTPSRFIPFAVQDAPDEQQTQILTALIAQSLCEVVSDDARDRLFPDDWSSEPAA